MKLEEARKLATPGPYWRDDDGFLAAGAGDAYVTFADLDCNDRDIHEREVNKALTLHALDMLPKLVEALERVLRDGTEKKVDTGIGPITVFTDAYNDAEAVLDRAKEVPGL